MRTKLIIFAVLATALTYCKKEDPKAETPAPTPSSDVTAPVITLNGKINDTIYLQSTYTDPGATVMDDTDGNITSALTTSGSVNATLTGVYLIDYHAQDAAGNQAATVTRTINVLNASAFLSGNYNVSYTWTAIVAGDTPTVNTGVYVSTCVPSSTLNNVFILNTLNIGPINLVPNITRMDGNSIFVYYSNGPYPFASASGTLSASKNSFTIDTKSHENMYPIRVHYCKSVFIKQ